MKQQGHFRTASHVWHEDVVFRENEILNKAIVDASGDYLIITDGDCVPRELCSVTH